LLNIVSFGGLCIKSDETSGFATKESYMNLGLGMKELEKAFRISGL